MLEPLEKTYLQNADEATLNIGKGKGVSRARPAIPTKYAVSLSQAAPVYASKWERVTRTSIRSERLHTKGGR